jgi:cell division protein FtsN
VVVPAPPEPAVAAASEEAALQPPGPAGSEEAALQPEPARPARKPEREPAAKAEPRKEPAGPVFAVQVRSYRDEEKAKEFVAELAGKGYKARVVRFAQGDGDAWYRVRVGRFRSSAVAGEFASKFNEREGAQAIPVEER